MSTFIVISDYASRLKGDNLEAILGEDPAASAVLAAAEAEAVSQVSTYLYQRYDTQTIFQQTGSARHAYLVGITVNIALYLLYQRLPKRTLPEWVRLNYEEAITFLERVDDGKTHLDLPRRTSTDDEGNSSTATKFRWGSNTQNRYGR